MGEEQKQGTRVTCEDLVTGETDSRVIVNDFAIICDGNRYLDSLVAHGNGTAIITVKVRR